MLPAEERISWIRQDRWIGYPRADHILKRLEELLSHPPRDRMPCLLLFGSTGMGKTRIVQKFLRDNRSSFDEITGTTRVPVAAIQMPPAPSERDFYEELLIGLGTVVPAGLSSTALRHRFRVAARQLAVRMLIVDEIHSMLAGTFREQRIFLNSIRFLANDLRIPLVCVGTHEAKQALMTDQQLADRFEAGELPAWRDDAALAQLLASFASVLPLRQPSELRDSKLQKRSFSLTEGVMVRVCRLLEEAAMRAIENGRECIEMESLTDDLAAHTLVSISDRRSRRVAG
jgi:hypothetical protein